MEAFPTFRGLLQPYITKQPSKFRVRFIVQIKPNSKEEKKADIRIRKEINEKINK